MTFTFENPSPAYVEALDATKRFHATNNRYTGRFLFRYAANLGRVIDKHECKTMLDYGCGKGVQYEKPFMGQALEDWLSVEVTKYDPAWPAFAEEPQGQFDIVVCTQVLGAIPISDIPWVVDRLHGFAAKAVFVGERVSTNPRKKLHAHMADQMAGQWEAEQYREAIRRDGSVPTYFSSRGNLEEV
jgi:hypothetical protein